LPLSMPRVARNKELHNPRLAVVPSHGVHPAE
jgi:hypothetical protein